MKNLKINRKIIESAAADAKRLPPSLKLRRDKSAFAKASPGQKVEPRITQIRLMDEILKGEGAYYG